MNQCEILDIFRDETICQYLDVISQIHMLTKHYLLIAEELSEEGVAFLQPLKEHRDAYDHLMRVFYLPTRFSSSDSDISGGFNCKDYITKNVEKAVGHEYRAFFETADWLTFICRRAIRKELSMRSVRQAYIDNYGDKKFQLVRDKINNVPFEIAKYRTEKDIGKGSSPLTDVQSYKNTIDMLLEIYQQVMEITFI